MIAARPSEPGLTVAQGLTDSSGISRSIEVLTEGLPQFHTLAALGVEVVLLGAMAGAGYMTRGRSGRSPGGALRPARVGSPATRRAVRRLLRPSPIDFLRHWADERTGTAALHLSVPVSRLPADGGRCRGEPARAAAPQR